MKTKNSISILLIGIMAIFVTACGNNPTTADIPNSESVSAMVSSTSSVETNDASEPESTAVQETSEEKVESPTAAPSQKSDTTSKADNSQTQSQVPQNNQPSSSNHSETSQSPETSQPPASSTPTQTPTTSEPTQPAFDINYWIQFAKDYGKSIGLIYDEGTTGSWDTPLAAGLTLKYTERDIKDRLTRYKNNEGVVYFSVWAEARQDGSSKFDVYIGYA